MVFVKVVFVNDRSYDGTLYSYKAEDALSLDEGDIVVVQARDTFGVARVQSVSAVEDKKATRWVLSKVDVDKSKKLDDITKERAKIERALEARIAVNEKKRVFNELVKGDPVAAELLKQLEALNV